MRSSMGSIAGMIAMLGAGIAGGAPEIPRQLQGYDREARSRGHEHRPARIGSSPKAARHWHNPKDPAQAKRIAAAQDKRFRKDRKREDDANSSWHNNTCHAISINLDPFWVAQ